VKAEAVAPLALVPAQEAEAQAEVVGSASPIQRTAIGARASPDSPFSPSSTT
jgi:hypothetical protein